MIDEYDKCECHHARFEHVNSTDVCARCLETDYGCQKFERLLTYQVLVAEILDEKADHMYVSRKMATKLSNLASPFTSLRFDGSTIFMGAVLLIDDSLADNQIAFGVDKQRHVEFA
jgi:hypothetical protein